MPTENCFDLNTPDGGRGYIANLFKTVLKRHDYRQYIAERLAGDFACTLAQHFERITAERDALQLRLNEADQRIDELTPSNIEHPEGRREKFQKWVMATKHPVFGFLDGRSLARSDDREGYADEYVQGLWVSFKAFAAEHSASVAVASRDESISWLKRIDGIGQNRAELIYSMGFRRHTEVPLS